MKLVVGLGNPGKKYENTRHNCGFRVIDNYVQENNLTFKTKFNAEYTEHIINNEKVLLVKPQTYMNLSGDSVIKFVNYYNIDVNNILIIYDDVDFEVGKFRIKRGGSSNGHNGINNIITHLKTQNIYRLKIGISKNQIPLMDYVLSNFSKEENEKLNNMFKITNNIINDFSTLTIDKLMEKYNGMNNEQ